MTPANSKPGEIVMNLTSQMQALQEQGFLQFGLGAVGNGSS
jgi:hypothetical protein